jgi:hypothetical protein
MNKLTVPKFESDEQEAQWWYDHKDIVEHNLSEALRNGTGNRGTMQRVLREARRPEPREREEISTPMTMQSKAKKPA